MITAYLPTETNFNHNGLGVLNPTKAEIIEELNGMFELSLSCYNTGVGLSPYNIGDFYILKAPTPRGAQLFRVYNITKVLSGEIRITARHVFYDALNSVIGSVNGSSLTADAAIKLIFNQSEPLPKITVSSNLSASIKADIDFQGTNPINALMDDEGIIEAYGGELLRNNFTAELKSTIGVNRGFKIMYRKNLTGLNFEVDTDDIATRLMPVAQDSDGEPLLLPEKYIDSPLIGLYHTILAKPLPMTDIRIGSEDYPNSSDAYAEMRKRCQDFYNTEGDRPKINAKADFVLLKDTYEYQDYKVLEQVSLGDTVSITHSDLDISLTAKCIKYTYDAVLDRYKSIELGQFRGDFVSSTSTSINRIAGNATRVSGTIDSQLGQLATDVTALKAQMSTHAHKGTDSTQKISYNDLKDLP